MSLTGRGVGLKFLEVMYFVNVTVGQVSENVGIETILYVVLKFQVNRTCFYGGKADATFSEKRNMKE